MKQVNKELARKDPMVEKYIFSDKQDTLSWQEMQELTIDKGTMAVLRREAVLYGSQVNVSEGGKK
jgi:hypothetical protein